MEMVKLFGDFCYGMAANEIEARTKAAPDSHNSLILQAPGFVKYLNLDWSEQFFLNNQAQLQQVVLMAVNPVAPEDIVKELLEAGRQPIFMETDDAVFDRLQEASTQGREQAARLAKEFVRQASDAGGSLAISFLPTDVAEEALLKGQDFNQAVDSAGEDLVVIRLIATGARLKLSFTAPLLARKNALRYGQMIRRN